MNADILMGFFIGIFTGIMFFIVAIVWLNVSDVVKRKRLGKWTSVNAVDINGILCTRYRCSKCGKDSKDMTKYCGNCRAEMNLED